MHVSTFEDILTSLIILGMVQGISEAVLMDRGSAKSVVLTTLYFKTIIIYFSFPLRHFSTLIINVACYYYLSSGILAFYYTRIYIQ